MKNKIYKVLAIRDDGGDWKVYLDAFIVELRGYLKFHPHCKNQTILHKLSGLDESTDAKIFRKIILDCLAEWHDE